MKDPALLLVAISAISVAGLEPIAPLQAADLSGHKLLVPSVRTEVFIADPTVGDMFNVTRSPQSEDRYPCWSPNAKQICFMSDREGTTNLWICDADGSHVRRLNRTSAVCYMPNWQQTPHGERIVFGKHGDKPEMASIKPDGSDEQILGEGHDPTLSPNGLHITYTGHASGGVTVFVMNFDGSDKRQIVPDTSKVGATFPNWQPIL
jgi:TolB protein